MHALESSHYLFIKRYTILYDALGLRAIKDEELYLVITCKGKSVLFEEQRDYAVHYLRGALVTV